MPKESFDEIDNPEANNANETAVEVSADDLMQGIGNSDGAREAAARENNGSGVLQRFGEVAGKKGQSFSCRN